MKPHLQDLISLIHKTDTELVIAVTGGGTQAVADLLGVPGASHTILEALVPYSEASLTEYLGSRMEQAVCEATAVAMAQVALRRATRLSANPSVLGVSCTASLATNRPKKGIHRAHIAVASARAGKVHSVTLAKGERDREAEELVVSELLIHLVALSCSLPFQIGSLLLPKERIEGSSFSC